jgi:cobalt-zinc-cadmium resistance protein CzcA
VLNSIIEICVHRRVAALFVTAIIAIFGIRAYLETPIEAFPDVTNAQVTVITTMPGAAPEEIERQVTTPLERALNGTPGSTLLRSESLFGLSLITLIFDDKSDSFSSRLLVSQRLAGADLPEGVNPVLGPDATPLGEIYLFRLTSDRHDLYELRSEMEWNVTRVLRQIQGVADVLPFGGYLKEVHVRADPARLYAAGLTLGDLAEALSKANRNVSGGFLVHGDQEMVVRGVGYIESADDIKAVMLRSDDGTPVTVGDVADVALAATPRRGSVGWNDQKEVVEGFVVMRRGENPSVVLNGIHQKIKALNDTILPEGMRTEVFYDRSELVNHTLSTVHTNLLHGFVLVVAVVWLFLRSLIGSAVVAVVIPLSLLTAFIGLYALGLPANLISMGAIDFGILVDGAVVVVEHVMHSVRHERPQNRKAMLKLVVRSALDVGRPTFFAMLIIIAALLPVFTLQSVEGRIFRPLALTYAFALLGALVFAVTLVPALCAFLFKPKHAAIEEPRWVERLRSGYGSVLGQLLAHRTAVILAGVCLVVAGLFAASRLGTEFLPELDEGDIVIFVEMPASISMEKGQDILLEVRRRIMTFPEVLETLSEHGRPEDGTDNEGVNMSETIVRFKPLEQWPGGRDKAEVIQDMRASLTEIPGVRYNFSQPIKDNVEESVAGVRGKVVLKIFGPDLVAMRDALESAKASIQSVEGVVDLDLYRDGLVPQLRVSLDRAALARAGVSVDDAQQTIETALAGQVVTEFWEGERPVPVRLMLPLAARDDTEKIAGLQISTPSGARIPLAQVAKIEIVSGMTTINREGNSRYLALKFNIEGRDMGSVVKDAIANVARDVKAPDGHYFVWGGEFENQERAIARLKLIVPVTLLLVLGLLYAAMNSGRSALTVLLTMPFALTGGAFALLIAGVPLSVSAAVGFIALLGQVALLGLLVLTAAEARRRAGEPLLKALVDGATDRMRAVLMASLLAAVGLLPMALSTGIGSETQRPFALVVVGGMITTLIVALFLLPVIYSFITPKKLVTPEEADA